MKKYIGIDVSKSSIDVYDGKQSYKFENNELGFNSVVSLVEAIKETIFILNQQGYTPIEPKMAKVPNKRC